MNIEKYINKINYLNNEIRNYQAERIQVNRQWQAIEQSDLNKEDKQTKRKEVLDRFNEINSNIHQFIIEEEQTKKQAFKNHLLEITYGSLVGELQNIAEKKNYSIGFSHYSTVDAFGVGNFRLGINVVTNNKTFKSFAIFVPQGENPQRTFSEIMKMEYSRLKINIDPNTDYMQNDIICEAVYNCAKRKAKFEENNREKQ